MYKRWPVQSWVVLIERLVKLHLCEIVVIGGPKEGAILQEIAERSLFHDNVRFTISTFDELVAYTAACEVFIGLDSGPMNLAVCLGKRTLALFGPGDSYAWRPYGTNNRFIHYQEEFWCNPCFQRKCYFAEKNCMSNITVSDVETAVNQLLLLGERGNA